MKQTNYSIDVASQDEEVPDKRDKLIDIVQFALRSLSVSDATVTVIFVSKSLMQQINGKYRFKPENTDVLSFSYNTNKTDSRIFGEIFISPSAVQGYHPDKDQGQALRRCIVHGVLHLFGMMHPESEDSAMYRVQESILQNYNKEYNNDLT